SLMRARFKGASAHSAVAESPARPGPVPGTSEPRSLGQALVNIPGNRRVGGIPVMLVAGGALLLLVLAVIAYTLMPHLFAGDTVDVAALPNASTAAAGVPSAQVNPTLVAATIDAATAAGTTGAASAASAS